MPEIMPWRPMRPEDIPEVHRLADAIHVSHPEDFGVLAERQHLYPEGCLMLIENGQAIGYALTHPWLFGAPPPLNERLGEIPAQATTYYIHDIALLPTARGRGYAVQVANRVIAHACMAGFDNVSLVAVNRSQAFWEKVGFRVLALPGQETKLASYGSDAVLMVRDQTNPPATPDGISS